MREEFALLEPWCSVLRGRLATECKLTDNSALGEYWWVSVRPPPSFMAVLNREASDVRKLREALELLSLLAIVDNEAWKLLLVERCGLKLDDDDQLDGEFAPRFLLRFDAEHLRYSAMLPSATIRQFFLPRPLLHRSKTDGDRTSDGFQEALLTLLERFRAAGGRQELVNRWRKIPYALQFSDLWNLGQPVLSAHLSSLLVTLNDIRKHNEQLRTLTMDEDGTTDGHYFAYELEEIQMCLGTIPVSRDLPDVVFWMLSTPGFAISELQVSLEQDLQSFFRPGEVHPRDLAAHGRCGMLFNTIFYGKSVTKLKDSQIIRRSTIESVVIPMFGMDDQTFSGLCSSLAEASEVKKLTVNGAFRPLTPVQRTKRWQWLTYALFSAASRSSIEEINLMGAQLNTEDVDAIAEVLATRVPEPGQATNAAESVYANGGNRIEYVFVPKGTSIGIKESITSPKENATLETANDFMFRLLQDDGESDSVHVLVPGRGNGVISSSHVRKMSEEAPGAQSRSPNGVTSLSLSIDSNAQQSMSVLARFLGLVGRSLTKISIQNLRSVTMDVQAILKACPNLDQLYLDNIQIDLETLMTEIERGSASTRCLGLAYSNAPPQLTTRFAMNLADPHSKLANGMRELCLSADNEEFSMTDGNVKAFLDVLKTNDKLMYLDLLVSPVLFDKYAVAFRKHHQETLSLEKEKLPLPCRLAFLSVVRGHSSPVKDIFLHLDSHLIQQIFAFAAVSAKRTVCLRCDN
ncbi:hypothetical protein V7S43_001936 [Phytophthora oleae]|uniref:Uncharacterized protein n=1 Tax=Phytophthora oleae TaxID=2107226 RepID=A0ABD3G3X7_9STRA